ncbi:TIM barrel protein [Streptomyces sp. URMC 128]|uniref:sugar phosphate isomerase/epimerase and 4-hydroxyphenylpyruvate domain-containing protein n=1 Tax=Streptomyces sp. URMC 128 TaxID=3423404 RepID=UPI003F1D94B2
MRKSIATVCLSGSLSEKLTAAARAGFHGVEIFENDLLASRLSPEQVRERAADLGLAIELYQPLRDIEAVSDEQFTRNLRRAEHKFQVMRQLGADVLLVCSQVSGQAVDDDALAAEQLRLLAERAHEHGIRVAYEALAWGRHVSTYDHAWRIVQQADHPALGLCLDSFHILSRDSDLAGIERIPAEKIFFLQLADAPVMAMDVLQWSRHHRCFPGQGGLDVAGLVRHVVNAGYRGPLSLEVFNDVFRQSEAGPTATDALRSLIALEKRAGVCAPPAPLTQPSGIAFAAITSTDPQPVTALLGALGFVRTHKQAAGNRPELWEQNDARVLVDSGSATRRDGARLAGIGVRCPDPDALVDRAASLLVPVLVRRRGEPNVSPHTISAPGRTEVFLCATSDRATGACPATAGALLGIDHVALTQPGAQFDQAVLFHRSVLGLRPQESVEVADPCGLLRSRALSNDDGSLRLVLNLALVPEGDDHPAQHIAFVTDDILAAARRFRAAGAETLAIPANYHDDLDARYDLDPAELAAFREFGILYDRDEHGGEFRHFYTATVGRVFFEVVQRTGGYDGYGAANTFIRLAAQRS